MLNKQIFNAVAQLCAYVKMLFVSINNTQKMERKMYEHENGDTIRLTVQLRKDVDAVALLNRIAVAMHEEFGQSSDKMDYSLYIVSNKGEAVY